MEYEWENANTKFSLGYIQAKYADDPNDNFRRRFSIGAGFNIPWKGSKQTDLNDLKIKILEYEYEYKEIENQLGQEIYTTFGRLTNLLDKHELISRQLTDSQAEHALREYAKIAEAPPRALLKLRENTLKKEWLLQKLKLDITKTYIAWLDAAGLLGRQPYVNYLSKDLEHISH
ncbi:MAG TPA: hypothetical protein ENJ20_04970 [Bacteroidetes bacterium]|nr:hypothetical protein [Bacteroidota bacterium]